MATRISTKHNHIDPVKVCTLALKHVKCAADYHRIENANSTEIMTAAWEQLHIDEQQRLTELINSNAQLDPQNLVDELIACGVALELKRIKAEYGEMAVKAAWKLLPQFERDRIKAICESEPEQIPMLQPEPAFTNPQAYQIEQRQQLEPSTRKQTLIELSAELQQIDSLLETIEGDIPVDLQTSVDELLAQRESTTEALLEKLDNYCALIQSRLMWASARKAEADRLAKLAESDIKAVEFLKGRLKTYLEATNRQKLRTKRFNISVCANGGKAPLRFDNTLPEQMPERFKRVMVEPDTDAIRAALEAGEKLSFAFLKERESHLRIK